MTLPAYPEYKDSGVEWLGEVPSHWEVTRIKRIASIRYGIGEPPAYVEDGTPLIRATNVREGRVFADGLVYVDPADIPEKRILWLQDGDIIVVRSGAYTGDSAIIRSDLCPAIAGFDMVVRQENGLPDFLQFALLSQYLKQDQIFLESARAAQPHLNAEELGSCVVVLPPLSEQSAIASFLGRETDKIDALIAEQEKLIELLREKRKAVISHAVTKGLDPTASMKDSGIEWLGEVPAHWGVVPLKRDLEFLTSGSRGWAEHYADDGALFIRIGNLTRDSISLDLSDIQRVAVPEGAEGERTRLREGDVLFSITAYLGSVAVAPEDMEAAYVSQHVALARLRQQRFLPRWVALVTLSYVGKTYLGTQGYGGTKIQLSLDDVASAVMTCPPLDEQVAIVAHLARVFDELDALISESRRVIDLLKERRLALISAAVTGKIDVRQPSAEIIRFIPRQRRNILAAEVLAKCHLDQTFGRTKAQKTFYLIESHLGIEEMGGQYTRYARGPYDGNQMDSIAADLEVAEWFREVEAGPMYVYRPLAKVEEVHGLFEQAWTEDQRQKIDDLIALLRPLDTRDAEVVATLYAAWNDFLLLGQEVDDDKLITEVLTNWHKSKLEIAVEQWRKGLRWMRKNNIIPHGTGRPTIYQTSLL